MGLFEYNGGYIMKIFKKLFLLPLLVVQLHAENPVQRIAARTFHKFKNRLGLTARVDIPSFRKAIVQTAQDVGPAFTKFVQQYGISGEALEVVFHHTAAGKNLPSYIENTYMGYIPDSNVYNKGAGLDRIINALRMKEVIKRHNLTLVDVADKQIGWVKGQWRVFAKKVDGLIRQNAAQHKISLEYVKELIIFITETGYSDLHWGNWIWDTNGKLTCIDTEDRSFGWDNGHNKETKLDFVTSLNFFYHDMTPEAQEYFNNYIRELGQEEQVKTQTRLPYNSAYDPEGINLEKVKAEYVQYTTAQVQQ